MEQGRSGNLQLHSMSGMDILLATGPGNPPVVRVWTAKMCQFGYSPVKETHPAEYWRAKSGPVMVDLWVSPVFPRPYCSNLRFCVSGFTFVVAWRFATVSVSNGSGFGPEKRFGSVPEPSKNPTCSVLAGQTRSRTRQPAGFAGFG